jgi:DNA-binding MarR family transcriptional regulator
LILNIEKRIENELVQHTLELSAAIKRNGGLISAQIDLTTQQWMILLLLAGDKNHPYVQKNPGQKLMASDIADALGVSRPNITNLINSLIDKGLVTQTVDDYDKRKKILELTPAAFGLLGVIEPLRIDANERLLSEFSYEEKEIFLSYLRRCLEYINRPKH